MKVSSPVGDFPFEAEEIGLDDGKLIVRGSMGAWPARVEVGPEDVPQLIRLLPAPVLAGLGILGVAIIGRLLRGGRRSGGRDA